MTAPGGDIPVFDVRAKLRAHFKGRESEPGAWDDLWKDEFLPWDRKIPNPALVDILNDRTDLTGGSIDGTRRKKALVPGCGKGYDCLLLASYGYDAYGLEGSSYAIEEAIRWQEEHEKDYDVKNEDVGRGKVEFLFGDFFKNDWEKNIAGLRDANQGGFDLIYDYTVGYSFLCFRVAADDNSFFLRYHQKSDQPGRCNCRIFSTKPAC
jgi:SAM-dependent methyltransferase